MPKTRTKIFGPQIAHVGWEILIDGKFYKVFETDIVKAELMAKEWSIKHPEYGQLAPQEPSLPNDDLLQ